MKSATTLFPSPARRPTIYFVGVSSAQSTITRIFPRWAQLLGLGGEEGAELVGIDLPLETSRDDYRQIVSQLKADDLVLGAVITGHKLGVYAAAVDLFDETDANGGLCREVGQLRKRGRRLIAEATDPDDAGAALLAIVGPDYWGIDAGHVLLLGAGGAGTALLVHLLTRTRQLDQPGRVLVVDEVAERLDHLSEIAGRISSGIQVNYYRHTDPQENDELLAGLPPRSVVVNATGRGKDLPGSPVSEGGRFPWQGVAWELNYRGERQFLRRAEAQTRSRRLRVEDGWGYFVNSWARHLGAIFGRTISQPEFAQLQAIAEELRGQFG
jgi:shikimate dehydrogenase